MSEFIITTDNTADLPTSFLVENNIATAKLSFILDGKVYVGESEFDEKEFYGKIREGSMPTTTQISITDAMDFFEPLLKEGKDILHIGFSSGLSGSYNNYCVAANELKETYPDRKIVVIDSLCASLGEGLLVYYAVMQKKAEKNMEEIAAYLEELKYHICHYFTVDDLDYLYRGGRVSRMAAVLGSAIKIKPVLYVPDTGKLEVFDKVRGRKASLKKLVSKMEELMIPDQNDIIFISHGDCIEDAEYMRDLVQKQFGIESFIINPIGPVIGTHSGPGTLALFFVGRER